MRTFNLRKSDDPGPYFRRLLRLLSDAEEVADAIACVLGAGVAPPEEPDPAPVDWRRDPRWRDLARPGIGAVTFRPARRGCLVSIDGAAAFVLANRAAALLRALAQHDGPRVDEFAPWVPLVALARARGCSPHAVTVAIGRLRKALLKRGNVSPLLVETRRGEVRLRLRHDDAAGSPGAGVRNAAL